MRTCAREPEPEPNPLLYPSPSPNPNINPNPTTKIQTETLGFAKLVSVLPENIQSKLAPGTQLGPWFYAPALTSFVTPTFFGFLVGPSTINRREDGQLGGLVVEKCKFLQESSCKVGSGCNWLGAGYGTRSRIC